MDMSIEDTGSIFGKEMTCLSDRILKRKTQAFCENDLTPANDGFVWFRTKRPFDQEVTWRHRVKPRKFRHCIV